jgi:hypothetical protein
MTTTSSLTNAIRIAWSRTGGRLFRNNVGVFWTGSEAIRMGDGSVILRNARCVRCGLVTGSGDLIGWRPVTITADMVGQTFAQFASVEIKAGDDRVRKAQRTWLEQVTAAGGYAAVARSVEDVTDGDVE